jgi:hypothetical protein
MMVEQSPTKGVSIFHYSPKDHRFSSSELCLAECPSPDWVEEHHEWLTMHSNNTPSFDNIHDLHVFNQKGLELTKRLQEEFPHIKIAPFEPLYDKLKVSCDWWHLKDAKYNFPVSVQKLPVSNDLKADFMLWRIKKDDNCLLEDALRQELEREGQELQKRLYEELHQKDEDDEEDYQYSQSCRDYKTVQKHKYDRSNSF